MDFAYRLPELNEEKLNVMLLEDMKEIIKQFETKFNYGKLLNV